ncbi:MAG: SDR family oxidoreductase [Candidatus Riflebacteria bacterium]|nr:SDR family oxidoreductase [Candidatus Riflebacteria bacterium]
MVTGSTSVDARHVLVTGGAGYVGSVLVPKLLARGHRVSVIDLCLFGNSLERIPDRSGLTLVKADIRDRQAVVAALAGCDSVIHLACISNDPSFELDPELGRSINHDSFRPLVEASRQSGVDRFVFASSSSVYGVRDETDVTEEFAPRPLTDYSRYKALCEEILLEYQSDEFTTLILRPATVCGYSPRLRLDLTVNILTNHAVNRGVITVFGGDQKRPNLHIEDMTDLYLNVLEESRSRIAGKVFNAGYQNHTVAELARIVKQTVDPERVRVVTTATDDHRSYHISSERIRRELGFVPRRSIEDAVADLKRAFDSGLVPDAMDDPVYYNVRQLKRMRP